MAITQGRIRFQHYEFDPSTLELWQAGEPLHLPPKPSQALGLLVERAVSNFRLIRLKWAKKTYSNT